MYDSTTVLVASTWRSQVWYSQLLQLSKKNLLLLPRIRNTTNKPKAGSSSTKLSTKQNDHSSGLILDYLLFFLFHEGCECSTICSHRWAAISAFHDRVDSVKVGEYSISSNQHKLLVVFKYSGKLHKDWEAPSCYFHRVSEDRVLMCTLNFRILLGTTKTTCRKRKISLVVT